MAALHWHAARSAVRWLVVVLGLAGIAATALPFVPSNESWIRIWDFRRVQIAILLAVVLALIPFVMSVRRPSGLACVLTVAPALVWQALAIFPYTPLAPTEAKAAPECDPDARIDVLVANVLVTMRNAEPLLALVREVDPDVVLLVETDRWWDRQLEPLSERYPNVVAHPQGNGYGMHLFSRFELVAPDVRFLVDDYVPSIKTGLVLPSGEQVILYGIHPKPPPLQDTARRDAELLIVGREVAFERTPAIVAGDLNDVAWSRTSGLFQEVSGLLDPRIGRGTFSTFNANWPLLRWPLDHVFFEDSFLLLDVRVEEDLGSDHFPFLVALCHVPAASEAQEQPRPEPSETDAAKEAIEEGREEAED